MSLNDLKEYHRQYYQAHREKILQDQKRWREKNRKRFLATVRQYSRTHRKEMNENVRHRRKRLREEFLTAYGGRCTCCGETVPEFLTLEHKNGDGKAHRAAHGGMGVIYDLKNRGWPKNGYTILCRNCNYAVRDGKICPHKLQESLNTGSPSHV